MVLISLLNQSITVETYHSTDYMGDPSYNAGVVHNARVEGTIKRILTKTGEDQPATAIIYIGTTIDEKDRITLSDGSIRTILLVKTVPDASGSIHHSEVYI